MPVNDNQFPMKGPAPPLPDPHGQAALLLVESLIHGLLAQSIISTADAIEIVECAESVQIEIAEAADGGRMPIARADALLKVIARSLIVDRDDGIRPLDPVP